MRFQQDIHWAEGLFLQPHHLQSFQRVQNLSRQTAFSLSMPYPYGLIDYEFDPDALKNNRIVVKRLSAVMPGGTEISMPGNCVIPPLDLSEGLKEHRDDFTVYIALPSWSEYDANLGEDGSDGKHQFTVHETPVRDENSGDNEILIARHRFNIRLTADFMDNGDMELLPILQLHPVYLESGEPLLEINHNYIPPFLLVNGDCPLFSMATELNIQIRNRRNKIMQDLSASGYSTEHLSGSCLHSILQLRTLNSYEGKLTSLLNTGRLTPFGLYLELKSLLGELSALQPLRDFATPGEYQHLNYAPQFMELLMHIRALIMAEGVSSYLKLEFARNGENLGKMVELSEKHLVFADEYYLSVSCDGNPRKVVAAVESGDNFKLVNPSSSGSRIRGIKLVEMRYPPRFLPALPDTIWFKLDRKESPHVWEAVCKERAILLDWAEDIFPKLEVALYITTLTQGEK